MNRANRIALIAAVCHEANRSYCTAQGDHSQVPFDQAPQWQKESAGQGVVKALEGATPEQLHESWCQQKVAEGWVHGAVKDPVAKIHPCLVPYDELPEEQRTKDELFSQIVGVMDGLLPPAVDD